MSRPPEEDRQDDQHRSGQRKWKTRPNFTARDETQERPRIEGGDEYQPAQTTAQPPSPERREGGSHAERHQEQPRHKQGDSTQPGVRKAQVDPPQIRVKPRVLQFTKDIQQCEGSQQQSHSACCCKHQSHRNRGGTGLRRWLIVTHRNHPTSRGERVTSRRRTGSG